jgi:hypothetical protein
MTDSDRKRIAPESKYAYIHTPLRDIGPREVNALIDELVSLRPNLAEMSTWPVISMLDLFYYPANDRKRVSISSKHLSTEVWLATRVRELQKKGNPILGVVTDLVRLANVEVRCTTHIENHLHQRLYVALNQLVPKRQVLRSRRR